MTGGKNAKNKKNSYEKKEQQQQQKLCWAAAVNAKLIEKLKIKNEKQKPNRLANTLQVLRTFVLRFCLPLSPFYAKVI